jgi:hypothetical protein
VIEKRKNPFLVLWPKQFLDAHVYIVPSRPCALDFVIRPESTALYFSDPLRPYTKLPRQGERVLAPTKLIELRGFFV